MPRYSLVLAATLALTISGQQAWSAGDEALRIALPSSPPQSATVEARVFTEDGIASALARDLARELQRDLAATTMGDTGAHLWLGRPSTGGDIATGYRSGLTVAMRTDTDIADWPDIAGRRVCYTVTNTEARALIDAFGGIPVPERAPALSLMKVRTGECDAGLHEAALLQELFRQPDWQKFSATLPVRAEAPLVLGITDPAALPMVQAALAPITTQKAWQARIARWGRNVAFEVWLEQDAPDCH